MRTTHSTLPVLLAAAALAVSTAPPAGAETEDDDAVSKVWAAVETPRAGPARAIGSYRAGCVQGAEGLPLDGPGFQVMKPGRRRYYGHPDLVDYVRKLARTMEKRGLGALLVGDLGQPRGGPTVNGHASHQSGLDADLFYAPHEHAARRSLTAGERETFEPPGIVDLKTNRPTRHFTPRIGKMLRLAARDRRVERIFVHPVIKRRMCQEAGKNRAWLRKLRPWWGHEDHFHVRLACPAGSPDCQPQRPVGDSDGCDRIDWWFDEKAQAARRERRAKYRKRIVDEPTMPAACRAVLE